MAAISINTSTTTGSKGSASFLSYRKYGCCLCTRSGLHDLFEADTSILQVIRQSSSFDDDNSSLPNGHRDHNNHLALSIPDLFPADTSNTEHMSYNLIISGGIIWFIQYIVYSMLFSFYPMQSIKNYTIHNKHHSHITIYAISGIIALYPLISLIFIPIFQKYTLFYKIGLSRSVIIGLILQGLLCILFAFIPYIVNHSMPSSSTSHQFVFYLSNIIIRIFQSILSVLIELSVISIITQVTPKQMLRRQQYMPLFCMIGLITGPYLTQYLFCFGYGYEITFASIGIVIIISTLIVTHYMPSNINSISEITSSSLIQAFKNMNIIYSSIIAIVSFICITHLLLILPLYLNKINSDKFNIDTSSGKLQIAKYFISFGIPFTVLSFFSSNLAYRNCGSLRTMLSGLFGISVALLFISRTSSIFHQHYRSSLNPIWSGLIIMGISSAFSTTPYLLYLRNALFREYRNEGIQISFNIYRFSICLGILIGPIIGAITYSTNNYDSIQLSLFIFSIFAFLISIIGFILFKCLRWKRLKLEPQQQNSTPLLHTKNDNKTQKKNNIEREPIYEIRYIPILQDDKSFCCCCNKIMCFFSFGAIYDHKNEYYEKLKKTLKRNRRKKKKKVNIDRDSQITSYRKKSRRSFDETDKVSTETDKDEVSGKIVTFHKKSSKGFDKISFGGGTVEHEYTDLYGNDGKTITKDNIPGVNKDILAQSWNTVLNHDQNTFLKLPITNTDSSDNNSSNSPLSRERSRKLHRSDINTPRGHTLKAISNSQQKNAKNNNNNDDDDDNDDEDDEVEMSQSRKNTEDDLKTNKNDVKSKGNPIFDGIRRSQTIQIQPSSKYYFPVKTQQTEQQNINLFLNEDDMVSDDEKNRSRRNSAGSPSPFTSAPTTPHFDTNYYQQIHRGQNTMIRVQQQQPHSLSRGRARGLSDHSVQSSGTEPASQTFLLLSDEDFASRREQEDIYNDVPELQEESFTVQ